MHKIIWIYWHQGWNNAPEIVQKCLSSWYKLNPGWQIKQICGSTIENYLKIDEVIKGIDSKYITLTSLSDIIRIALLKQYGGLWVDSTLLCKKPLDSWLKLLNNYDFFAFANPGPDRLISSWFLFTKPGSYIINAWYEATVEYWRDRDFTDQYYWFHYQFTKIYTTNSNVKSIWDNTIKISADGPHYFRPYNTMLFNKSNSRNIKKFNGLKTPVFKLTYKYDHEKNAEDTMLSYLLKHG